MEINCITVNTLIHGKNVSKHLKKYHSTLHDRYKMLRDHIDKGYIRSVRAKQQDITERNFKKI